MTELYRSGTLIANRYEVVQGPLENPSLAGGMGIVYLCADHAEQGRPVALKTFKPEYLPDRAARDRFLREGNTWVNLGRHPHIVHALGVERIGDGSEVYIKLEWVVQVESKRDASLRSWLTPGQPLAMEQALLFALHIVRGMHHATTTIPGLVHRDLKPENVLVARGPIAKITDFGLATTLAENNIAGTAFYMAPEQWAAAPLDARADIYAFGCILYEMMTGRHVATGRNWHELKQAHCTGCVANLPQGLPVEVGNLIKKCLALKPVDRHGDWEAVEAEVLQAYQHTFGKDAPSKEVGEQQTLLEQIDMGQSYFAMGQAYSDISKHDMSINYFERALNIGHSVQEAVLRVVEEDNPYVKAVHASASTLVELGLLGLGQACLTLHNARQAKDYLEQYLVIVRNSEDRREESYPLLCLGMAYTLLNDAQRAQECYEQALDIAQHSGEQSKNRDVPSLLGEIYALKGNAQAAQKCYEQAFVIARESGNRVEEGKILWSLGKIYRQLGGAQHAQQCFERYRVIASEGGNWFDESEALVALGEIHLDLGNTQGARECYEQTLVIARESGNRTQEGEVLWFLGETYRKSGDTQRARGYHERALAIAQEIGDRFLEKRALFALGDIYDELGDMQQAIHHYEQCLTIPLEHEDRAQTDGYMVVLGCTYARLAEQLFEEANELVHQRRLLDAQPQLLKAQQCAEHAKQFLTRGGSVHQAQKIHELTAQLQHVSTLIEKYLGDASQSRMQELEQDLAIARGSRDRFEEKRILSHLGSVYYKSGDMRRAIACLEECLAIHRELGDRRGERDALVSLGIACADLVAQLLERVVQLFKQAQQLCELGQIVEAQRELVKARSLLGDAQRHAEHSMYLFRQADYDQGSQRISELNIQIHRLRELNTKIEEAANTLGKKL